MMGAARDADGMMAEQFQSFPFYILLPFDGVGVCFKIKWEFVFPLKLPDNFSSVEGKSFRNNTGSFILIYVRIN